MKNYRSHRSIINSAAEITRLDGIAVMRGDEPDTTSCGGEICQIGAASKGISGCAEPTPMQEQSAGEVAAAGMNRLCMIGKRF